MRGMNHMRRFLLIPLLILSVGLSACSYSTDFVVVNNAKYPIQVVYKIKAFTTPPPPLHVEPPRIIAAEKVEIRDRSEWTQLNLNQYKIDEVNRTVTLTLHAHEALWITSLSNYFADRYDVQKFPIEEVVITGAAGEMRFTGDKARQAFQEVSAVLYTLTYN